MKLTRSAPWRVSLLILIGLLAWSVRSVSGEQGAGRRPSPTATSVVASKNRPPRPLTEYSLSLPLILNLYDTSIPLFGVQMWAEVTSPQARTYAAQAGIRWIRTSINWAAIQPSPAPVYNWSATDQMITALTQQGFSLIITLVGNPAWAAQYPEGPVTNIADLIYFMNALVERYDGDGYNDAPGSPVVRYWEFYNEPDNTDLGHCTDGSLGCFGYHGDLYAQELIAVYPTIKAADPQAQLVFGGLALDNFVPPPGIFDPNFLDEVLSNCTGTCFDIMNFHWYPYYRFVPQGGRWEPYGRDIIGKATYVRDKLASYGFTRPVINTEANWPSAGWWASPELQARYVAKLYARSMAADLSTVIWYKLTDEGDPSLPGLLANDDPDLLPKSAYTAYLTLITELSGMHYVNPVPQSDPLLESYQFQAPGNVGTGRRTDVTWVDCTSLNDCITPMPPTPHPYQVQAGLVRIVDKYGAAATVSDCDDGSGDGYVTFQLTDQNPLYVEYLATPQPPGTACPSPTPGPTSTPGLPSLATPTPQSLP